VSLIFPFDLAFLLLQSNLDFIPKFMEYSRLPSNYEYWFVVVIITQVETQNTKHKTQNTKHKTQGGGLIAQNLSTSGGNVTASESAGSLQFSGATSGPGREVVVSTNAFDLTGGFILTFTYDISDAGADQPSESFSVGLISDPSADLSLILTENTTTDAIGFGARTRNGAVTPGLLQVESGTFSSVNDGQTVTDTGTVVIEVADDLSYSFSINGATASTGTLSAFDFTEDYNIVVGTQGLSGASVSSIQLEVVPEPSTTALLGLGGLALILRRRK